jgi:hypothetical protein
MPFKKGQSGNPRGRPKGSRSVRGYGERPFRDALWEVLMEPEDLTGILPITLKMWSSLPHGIREVRLTVSHDEDVELVGEPIHPSSLTMEQSLEAMEALAVHLRDVIDGSRKELEAEEA